MPRSTFLNLANKLSNSVRFVHAPCPAIPCEVPVYVLVSDASVAVLEADDCGSLDVRVGGTDRAELDAVLRSCGIGSWDGAAEADLVVEGLRVLAKEQANDAAWSTRWAAMIAYAT